MATEAKKRGNVLANMKESYGISELEQIAMSVLPLPQDMLALGTCSFTGSELNNLFGIDSRGFIVDKLNPFLGHMYVVMNGEVAYLSARLPSLEAALVALKIIEEDAPHKIKAAMDWMTSIMSQTWADPAAEMQKLADAGCVMHSGKVSGSTHGLIMIPPGHVTLLANIGLASASGAVHHYVVKIEQVKNDLAIWRERDDLSDNDRKRLDAILDSWGA